MTITGTGGTGCDDRLQPPEFRSPPASSRQGNSLLDAPSPAIAGATDEVWYPRSNWTGADGAPTRLEWECTEASAQGGGAAAPRAVGPGLGRSTSRRALSAKRLRYSVALSPKWALKRRAK